jgi:Arginase/agmatinase/formimionoglutamate hydrolase, arginase family
MSRLKIVRIGVELKQGCTIEGADLAIQALTEAGIHFDVTLSVIEDEEEYPRNLLYLPQVLELNKRIQTEVKKVKDEGLFPLTFGGDHALAIGTISAVANPNTGVFWVDAHGDCNTEKTTPSGRIHGMPLAVLQGDGYKELTALIDTPIAPEHIVLFGIRSLDPEEEQYIRDKNIKMYTMEKIREMGFEVALNDAMTYLKDREVHLSFDLDSIDPRVCKGVNTPVAGGLNKEEAFAIVEASFEKLSVTSMDIVEYNPFFDEGNSIQIAKKINRIVASQKGI